MAAKSLRLTFLNQSSCSLGRLYFWAFSRSWETSLSLKTFSNLVYSGVFALAIVAVWRGTGGVLGLPISSCFRFLGKKKLGGHNWTRNGR